MRVVTKIKTREARIILSPGLLDYYMSVGYVVTQTSKADSWTEVCVIDSCTTL